MNVLYVKFMTHAAKVTKKVSSARPVLRGVYHSDKGSLTVTDAYRLYTITNLDFISDSKTVNPITGENIDGVYPDTTRLIPDESSAILKTTLNVKQTIKAINAFLKSNAVNGNNSISFESKDNSNVLTMEDDGIVGDMKVSYVASREVYGVSDKTTFNTKYLSEALNLFKDIGCEEITLSSYGPTRPFTLKADKSEGIIVTVLILPIRTV